MRRAASPNDRHSASDAALFTYTRLKNTPRNPACSNERGRHNMHTWHRAGQAQEGLPHPAPNALCARDGAQSALCPAWRRYSGLVTKPPLQMCALRPGKLGLR